MEKLQLIFLGMVLSLSGCKSCPQTMVFGEHEALVRAHVMEDGRLNVSIKRCALEGYLDGIVDVGISQIVDGDGRRYGFGIQPIKLVDAQNQSRWLVFKVWGTERNGATGEKIIGFGSGQYDFRMVVSSGAGFREIRWRIRVENRIISMFDMLGGYDGP